MNNIATILAGVVLITLCAACTAPSGENGVRTGKIADQRLATYTPVRRLTYRNACGSEGPLTVCVDRITLSDTAALVEARITNRSAEGYVQSVVQGAAVMLTDNCGRTLAWSDGDIQEYPGSHEKAGRFRMEGHFSGDPYSVMVGNIRKITDNHADHGLSVVALLGE